MNAGLIPGWLDHPIWPQIQTMMLHDAYFKLMRRARQLTREFNGPIAWLIEVGYVTYQTLAVRRLCDDRRDVISLHTANPLRRPNVDDWNLQLGHLIEAQKAICQVAITLDRDLLGREKYANINNIVPVPSSDIMQDFRHWVPDADIPALWEFWHAHNREVNAWIR